MWVMRHALAVVIVGTALAAVATVFAFARPQYRPDLRSTTYDMGGRDHLTVQQVKRVFAAHGFALWNGDLAATDTPGVWYRPLEDATGIEVTVFGPKATVGWGRDRRQTISTVVGNVGVSYSGRDDGVIDRADAAIDELKG